MAKRVTLNGIKRSGSNWKSRDWWSRQRVRIWSKEHRAWWRDQGHGYTVKMAEAWLVDFPTAYAHTEHCGPEKQIVYHAALPYSARAQPEKR